MGYSVNSRVNADELMHAILDEQCDDSSTGQKMEIFLVDTTYLLQMIGQKKLGRVLSMLVVG